MAANSFWTKFKLLLWKNYLLKSRNKLELFVEIVVPVIFCSILLVIRYLIVPSEITTPTIYTPCEIDSIRTVRSKASHSTVQLWELNFAPNTKLLEQIVQEAATNLKLGWRGFSDAESLEMFMLTNLSYAGIIFDSSWTTSETYPKTLQYQIRFPGALRTASQLGTISSWMTKNIFPTLHHQGPRNRKENDGGLPPGYIREGFIAVQNAISSAYIKFAGEGSVEMPKVVLRRFPYPPYKKDPILLILDSLAGVVVVLSFVYPCTQGVKHVTKEKETQLKEAMKIMGLTTTLHWSAWFFTLWTCLVFTVAILVCSVKIPFFQGFTAAVITHTSWSLLFVFLSIYAAATIAFSFMISAFFRKASVAAAVGGLAWLTFYIPYSFSINSFIYLPLPAKLGLSTFINTALPFGFKVMLKWETMSVGAQWNNIFKSVTVEDNLCLAHVMGMMLVDTVLYLLITLYVEEVMPGAYGVPNKWYFLFTRHYWCPRRVHYEEHEEIANVDPERFEPMIGNNREIGIRLMKLQKKYKSKVAVNGLSLNMYEGEITVLLGHNGAGKTTTISMVTGIVPPDSGTAIVNGLNTLNDMRAIRQTLGYCPQYNILFDELTVREHIIFYSRLKGFDGDQMTNEVAKFLKLLDFEEKENAQAHTLSGGMKRKLSVGVALCGNSQVVLCDEPSSGMDPAARRALWDLLLSEKKGRTILLTTHFMDEADVLGDQIAIMSVGKLTCSGTPFFLKKKFGAGYQLICSKGERCKSQKVTDLLSEYIPEIEVKNDVGRELSYQLPEKYVNVFESMLKDLEASQKELDLDSYGISLTSLEDVFMRTGADNLIEASNSFISGNGMVSINAENDEKTSKDSSEFFVPSNRDYFIAGRVKRLEYQWRAMFLKKYYYLIRNWHILLIQLTVPLFFIILSIYISKSMVSNAELPPLPITLDSYGSTTTVLEPAAYNETFNGKVARNYGKSFMNFKEGHRLDKINEPMIKYILGKEEKSLFVADTRYMVAATFEDSQITGWFNNEALHTAPLSLNLILNAIAKTTLGSDYNIDVTNYPLPYSVTFRMQMVKNTGSLGFQLALNLAFAMSFISASFIMFLIKERDSRAKLLQFVSGLRTFTFWAAHIIWDFSIYLLITLLVTLLMWAFQQEGFATGSDLERIFLVFVVYGFSSLPFTYLVSFIYNDPATGLSRLAIYNVFTGCALYIVCVILSLPAMNLGTTAELLQEIFLIFPNFALAQALANQAELAATKNICSTAKEVLGVPASLLCFVLPECCKLDPYGLAFPGIGRILIFLAATGIFFILFLFGFEYFQRSAFKKIANKMLRPSLPEADPNVQEDDDVLRERKKVSNMSQTDIRGHNLVIREATKFYKKFLAVRKISLAIDSGECFGLLGSNGAGKTTTFKMLTGDVHLSYGDVWVNGYNTKNNMLKIYEMIGYCPQFDGLFMDLTGEETLRIFCLLRGIQMQCINKLIKRLAADLAFEKHLKKKVEEYSGGNRRKLSTAIAILGQPKVVYLDEPTTGIDPVSRRRLWDMICYVRDLGKAIVITSHSMEECEALCTRIAIMVNGEMKCLGSTQHLKSKFSQGISLSVKLKSLEHSGNNYDRDAWHTCDVTRPELSLGKSGRDIYNFIIQKFNGAVLKDCHKNLLTFDIPPHTMPYSRIFGLMEANKENLQIEDYSICQTTLEQVFLDFALRRRNGGKNNMQTNDFERS